MKIVAVSACIAGLAHTYMAKTKLEKEASKRGYDIKVETQGAMGIENKISEEEAKNADVAIFAVDTNVSERDRFSGKPVLEVGTKEAIKNIEDVLNRAEKLI
ncbi:PTS system, fructose-specific IIB component [Alkalibacterium gilvum]|jgi:PTS system fructose-specific IIB component/fructose-specific PTS system IIB-like component|uniref:PTS system, fructose-specific IIB component n=1 Tax=Alkalibacterium gilvum TaxID=1130080 RepID=A0A1H6V874_9LACT|nr:PTS fructose transporter subunit IIB [Alkalibacterium gilvum]SEJ00793.1 PTS system, fructose-specific IIB component [Alkalibacterium gilvum]